METTIYPHSLKGEVHIPSSKSDVHRNLLCAALADEPTSVYFRGLSEDIQATIRCLEALGAKIQNKGVGGWQVTPFKNSVLPRPTLDCGESGSTLRFLLPIMGALGVEALLTGEGRLPLRPLAPLLSEMERHGCTFSAGRLPFRLSGQLAPGEYSLPGNVSSQFITGLLFALPLLSGNSQLTLTSPLESRSYVEMTLTSLRRFGISIQTHSDVFFIPGGQVYRTPGTIHAEGDWSNAAFWLSAGALGMPITCHGISGDSSQGDRKIVSLLREFGAQVEETASSATVFPGQLRAISINASDIPDLVPALSIVAAAADGQTEIQHAGRLRLKESDRLSAVQTMLKNLGGDVTEFPDGLCIRGGKALTGGRIQSFFDHRIAMSAAVASLLCKESVVIEDAEAVQKSYPEFFQDFQMLGGIIHVIHDRQ